MKTSLNSKNIVSKINAAAMQIKEPISKSVFNKVIRLKIDVATRMKKKILGVNVQYTVYI